MDFSHLDSKGNAVMVDTSQKPVTKRTAKAIGKIRMHPETIRKIRDKLIRKGDVLTVAKIAGVTGGKRTSDLIPLCHNIRIDQITVECELYKDYIGITGSSICTKPLPLSPLQRLLFMICVKLLIKIWRLPVFDCCRKQKSRFDLTW